MTWWQTLLAGGTGVGGGGILWRVLKSRKLRQIAVDVLDGPDSSVDAVAELRVILDEQRRGYEHLAGRVEVLEGTISELEKRLIEEQSKADSLRRQLRDERKKSGARISDLEKQLAAAQHRIDHLEALLEHYQKNPDGPTV